MALLDFLKKKKGAAPDIPNAPEFNSQDDFFPPPPGLGPNLNQPALPPASQFGQMPQMPANPIAGPPPQANLPPAPQLGPGDLPPPDNFNPMQPNFAKNPAAPPQLGAPVTPPPAEPTPLPEPAPIPKDMPPAPDPPAPTTEAPEPPAAENNHVTLMTDDIEQIADAIIDEKLSAVNTQLSRLEKWKATINTEFKDLKNNLTHIEKRVDQTQKSIMSKVSDYQKSINSVDTEIKAMSKVFEKMMPTFTDNVKQLSKMVDKEKKTRGRPKKK